MPIKFACPSCKKTLTVRDEMSGKRAGCPGCKKPLTVPVKQVKKSAEAEANDRLAEELALAAFAEEKAPAKVETPKTIDFECPQCGEALKLPIDLQGKQAPCPECRRIIKVPLLVKRDPTDWRKADTHLPSAARRDNEPAPEGAWGSTLATPVSRQALDGGVTTKRKRPLTRQQKITRASIAAGAIVVLGLATWFGISWLGQRSQDRIFAQAYEYLSQSNKAELPSDAQAALYQAAGTYTFNKHDNGCAEEASKSFLSARGKLKTERPGEVDFLVTEHALALIEMGGAIKSADVGQRRLLPWDGGPGNIITQLGQTLTLIHPEARGHALRKIVAALLAKDQGKLIAVILPQMAGKTPSETSEIQAIAGLEFLRNGDQQAAKDLATQALDQIATGKDKNNDKPLVPSPYLVALSIALDRPDPSQGREGENALDLKIGQAAGEALKSDLAKVRTILDTIDYAPDKWRALVFVSSLTPKDTTLINEAVDLFEKDLKDKSLPPWLLYQAVETGLKAGISADRLRTLAAAIPDDAGLRGQAELEIFRSSLKTQKDVASGSSVDSVQNNGAARLRASLDLARHNARLNNGFVKDVEGWTDEKQKAFGLMGVALGLQDKKAARK